MLAKPQLLVVGIGNIILPLTNHSVGHYVLDGFSQRLGVTLKQHNTSDGQYASATYPLTGDSGQPWEILLFKPNPAMNILGNSVAKVFRETVNDPRHVLVLQDTMYLSKGRMKVKYGGSPEGHRGIRSVNKFLQTSDYFRLQIGIGRQGEAREYVLARLDNYMKQYYSENGEGMDEAWDLLLKHPQRVEKLQKSSS